MAMITDVVARHFKVGEFEFEDPTLIVSSLDAGLYSAGKMVECLHDQVLHGQPGSGTSQCDPEEVGSGLEALLAYLGQLGLLVDQLDRVARSALDARTV
ncbi:hypothetical protein [Sphingomonas oryzagri]